MRCIQLCLLAATAALAAWGAARTESASEAVAVAAPVLFARAFLNGSTDSAALLVYY
jgi:hypothetical protein